MGAWMLVETGSDCHVMPVGDTVGHDRGPGCICGPAQVGVLARDGQVGIRYTHHALDGREHSEPDHDRRSCPLCSAVPTG